MEEKIRRISARCREPISDTPKVAISTGASNSAGFKGASLKFCKHGMVCCQKCVKEAALLLLNDLEVEVASNLTIEFTRSYHRSFFDVNTSNGCFMMRKLSLPLIPSHFYCANKDRLRSAVTEALSNPFCQHLSPLCECDQCVDTWLKHAVMPLFKAIVGHLNGRLSPDFKAICDRERGRGSIKGIAFVKLERTTKTIKLLALREAHVPRLIMHRQQLINILTHEALHSWYCRHTKKFYEAEKKATREIWTAINNSVCFFHPNPG